MTKSESDQITLLTSAVGKIQGILETALPGLATTADLLALRVSLVEDIHKRIDEHVSTSHKSMTPATRAKLVAAVTGFLTAATAALYFLIS